MGRALVSPPCGCYTRDVSVLRLGGLALAALALAALLTCNDPRLGLLDGAVRKGVTDSVDSGPRTRIDVLWVIDNSGSMCQEQANLIDNFRTFVTGLANLEADTQMAVVTTDMGNPDERGNFQHHPARDFHTCTISDPEKGVYYCLSDEDCGEGGCLCGVPWLRRCEADAECPDGQACISSGGGSTVRFCSVPCQQHSECQTALTEEHVDAFSCGAPGGAPPGGAARYCVLRVCEDDTFCPAEAGYRCLPSGVPGDGEVSYCRQFVNLEIACTPGASSCPLGLACRADRTNHLWWTRPANAVANHDGRSDGRRYRGRGSPSRAGRRATCARVFRPRTRRRAGWILVRPAGQPRVSRPDDPGRRACGKQRFPSVGAREPSRPVDRSALGHPACFSHPRDERSQNRNWDRQLVRLPAGRLRHIGRQCHNRRRAVRSGRHRTSRPLIRRQYARV